MHRHRDQQRLISEGQTGSRDQVPDRNARQTAEFQPEIESLLVFELMKQLLQDTPLLKLPEGQPERNIFGQNLL